jgi:hypothetical protein
MIADPIHIRRRTPLPVMAYAVYPYHSNVNMSLRYAARSLRSVIVRGYTSIWRCVQRLGPILGSFGAERNTTNNMGEMFKYMPHYPCGED